MSTDSPASARVPRVFLLSPAHCGGKRASLLMRQEARFPLAERLRLDNAVTLGEVFSFLSGLYFRGKLAYAERFASSLPGLAGIQVITTNRGLLPAATTIGLEELREFGTVEIHAGDERYRLPLERDLAPLVAFPSLEVVLLGSIATGKYVDILVESLGDRLLFPTAFVGRGDMSRGALLLRAVREGVELDYERVVAGGRRRAWR